MSVGVPCPRCRAPLDSQAPVCPACGGPAVAVLAPGDERPSCAMHPTRVASAICGRCGVFGCATCLVAGDEGVFCRRCHHPSIHLGWDDPKGGSLLRRFGATAWAVLARPTTAAREVGPGSVAWSWCFAAICLGLQCALWLPILWTEPRENQLGIVVFLLLATTLWLLVLPFAEFLVVRALGMPSRPSTHLRTSAYAMVLFTIPLLSCVAVPFWGFALRFIALREAHRLSWPHALLAVSVAPVLGVCLLVALRRDLFLWVW